MSAIYNLEPQPTGSAIIHTTLGEISVELFAKQTPLACRNFLQLALDGYYDGTIFHRLVPNFILQGGDPTGTGNGGESIFDGGAYSGDLDPWPMDERRGRNAGPQGVGFKDEFHSRLKFNRRGLLGMANEGHKDTNGSQFFFTLDKADELNGKNTMFGRVAGDTIYNLAKIGELEVDAAAERPLYPVKVEKIEVLVNPFEDMKKRERTAAHSSSKATAAPEKEKKKKRKGGKQLLSFGGDEEGDEDMPVLKKTKFDTRIVMEDETEEAAPPKPKSNKAKGKERKSPTTSLPTREPPAQAAEDSSTSQATSKRQASQKERDYEESSPEPEPAKPEKTALEKANEEMAALKASMRRTVQKEQKQEEPKKSALESMIPETSMRARKRRPGQVNSTAAEEQEAMKLLKDFQSRLERAPPSKGKEEAAQPADHNGDEANNTAASAAAGDDEAELCDLHFIANCQSCTSWDKQENEDASDDEDWMSHTLTFAADRLGKDLTNRRKAEEELVVIDPRDRARTLKEEKRAERSGGSSGGGRAWDQGRDQARNAKLAKAAALGGRGAR
jgi:peptidyl-prolyl cis-trans isomerase SDCCAG10